jgi:sugar lactone lactonase YvrE
MRTVDYIPVGAVPESIELSPDGKLLAVVLMSGSNFSPGDPNRTTQGGLVLLTRTGKTFRVVEEHGIGRIPEGVAFTSDGKYLVVQCHPDRELWIFVVQRGRLKDTGRRIKVPGMPSSMRASPPRQ